MVHRVGTAILLLFLAAGTLPADDVYLKNGGKLSGKVTDLGNKIKLQRSGGITVTISKDQILRIVKKATPDIPAKPSPKKPPAPKKPGKATALKPKLEKTFPTDSPQIEAIEYRSDRKYAVLYSAGNVPVQIRDTRDWSLKHEDGLKIVFQKNGNDILCLRQSRGEFGYPVLHRLLKGNRKDEVRFLGSVTQGLVCTEGAAWVAGWRGTFLMAWDKDKPEIPVFQTPAFRSKIHGIYFLPKKDLLVAHGDRSWSLWDPREGKKVRELDYSKLESFRSIGSTISADRKVIVIWSHDRVVTVDPETLKFTMGEPLDVKLTKRAWLSPAGTWLGATIEGPDSPREYPIAVLSTKSRTPVKMEANLPPMSFALPNTLIFSEDEMYFGANPNGTTLHILSTVTWTEVATQQLPAGKQILAAGFSPKARQLLLADDQSVVHVVRLQ